MRYHIYIKDGNTTVKVELDADTFAWKDNDLIFSDRAEKNDTKEKSFDRKDQPIAAFHKDDVLFVGPAHMNTSLNVEESE